jgi:hypothetical protein
MAKRMEGNEGEEILKIPYLHFYMCFSMVILQYTKCLLYFTSLVYIL